MPLFFSTKKLSLVPLGDLNLTVNYRIGCPTCITSSLLDVGLQPGSDANESAAVQHIALVPAKSYGFQYVTAQADGTVSVWRSDGMQTFSQAIYPESSQV